MSGELGVLRVDGSWPLAVKGDGVAVGLLNRLGEWMDVAGSVRAFDEGLRDGTGCAVRLMTADALRYAQRRVAEGATVLEELDTFRDSCEVHAPLEEWVSPGDRGVVGLSLQRPLGSLGLDGAGHLWCVQLVLPTNFRWSGNAEMDNRLKKVARGFVADTVGETGVDVWVVAGMVEVWARDVGGILDRCERSAKDVHALGKEWLERMDQEFSPLEQAYVLDSYEACRQLLSVADMDEGELYILRDAALRGGNVREAALIDVAMSEGVGWHVTLVPGDGELPGGDVILGAGRTAGASMAQATCSSLVPGVWPLHAKGEAHGWVGGVTHGRGVVHGVELTDGTFPCSERFGQEILKIDRALWIPEGVNARGSWGRKTPVGTRSVDFEVLERARMRGRDVYGNDRL